MINLMEKITQGDALVTWTRSSSDLEGLDLTGSTDGKILDLADKNKPVLFLFGESFQAEGIASAKVLVGLNFVCLKGKKEGECGWSSGITRRVERDEIRETGRS